jgi:alpha/beta superfamily hydrolase
MKEEAVLFGNTASLVGVVTAAPAREAPADRTAVLLLNAGRTHRVGPNRLYVNLARALAEMGFVVLRFDFSGVGDSNVRRDNLPAEQSALVETQEAMDYLSVSRGIKRFVLIGLCSGALASFKAACRDSRVVGAAMINGRHHFYDTDDAFSVEVSPRPFLRHYGRIALFSSFRGKNWLKALKGQVSYWALLKAVMSLPLSRLGVDERQDAATSRVVADFRLLADRGVHLLHIYSEGDQSLDCYHVAVDQMNLTEKTPAWLKAEVIRGANHAFTMRWSQDELTRILCEWMQEITKAEPASLQVASQQSRFFGVR